MTIPKRPRWAALLTAALVLWAADFRSDGKRWWSHIQYLADDKLEGRNTGSEGYRKAATYVAGQFERAGLKPAGTSAYFQPVKFKSRRIVEEQSSLALVRGGQSEPVKLGEEAIVSMRVDPAPSVEAPLVFAGYGLSVPEMKYDDLAGLDLRGKIVVYLTGAPPNIPGPLSSHYQSALERGKALERAGAIGSCSIPNPASMDIPWPRMTLARFQPAMSLDYPDLNETFGQKLSVTINPAHAGRFLQGSGHSFDEILAAAKIGKTLPRFAIPAVLKATVKVERAEVESPNVIGILPGSDPKLKDEYVVLSAHLDHVGVGRPINGDKIYNGAMDDASGVASLLDIAEMLHETNQHLRRSLLFVTVTGEEKGLLGSQYFAGHPTVNPKSMVADLNVDMFLPLFPLHAITVYGLQESDLGGQIRAVAEPLGIRIQDDSEPLRNIFIRSDQYNFIRNGVPSLAFKFGYDKGSPEEGIAKKWLKDRYHAPSDDLNQPVDQQAAADFNRVMVLLAQAVANRTERPKWNANSFFKRFEK